MSQILRRFVEAGLIDPEVLAQMKTWGMTVPEGASRSLQSREDLEQFLEELDTLVTRAAEGFPLEVRLDQSQIDRAQLHRLSDNLTTRTIGPALLKEGE